MKNILKLFSICIISSAIFQLGCKSGQKKVSDPIATNDATEDRSSATKMTSQPRQYIINSNGDTLDLILKSDDEWRKILSKEEYYVMRQKGTERAFTDNMWDNKKDGMYICKACNTILFNSGTKFDSGTGWPSFYKPVDKKLIKEATDHDLGYARTEVMCARCGGHLGHVFDDGPPPTGLRYCMNGVSLNFIEAKN
jgi:peptide-methionine (R)-S-oxide reductase